MSDVRLKQQQSDSLFQEHQSFGTKIPPFRVGTKHIGTKKILLHKD